MIGGERPDCPVEESWSLAGLYARPHREKPSCRDRASWRCRNSRAPEGCSDHPSYPHSAGSSVAQHSLALGAKEQSYVSQAIGGKYITIRAKARNCWECKQRWRGVCRFSHVLARVLIATFLSRPSIALACARRAVRHIVDIVGGMSLSVPPRLAFAWFYSSESGLFKGLHGIQIEKIPCLFSPPGDSRDAGSISHCQSL